MNKERILLIMDDQSIVEIDAADKELKVNTFSLLEPMLSDTLVTFQPDELIKLLGLERICNVNILDFECLDKQIRQSIGLQVSSSKWNVANMIATFLRKEERKWKKEEYEELLKELTLCYRIMKEQGKEEWPRITNIEIPINKILYKVQAKGIYFNNSDVALICKELHQKLYSYKNTIQLELNYTGDDLISYLNKHNIEHNLNESSSDKEYRYVCKQHPDIKPFWKARVTKRDLKCLLLLSAVNREQDKCKPLLKGFASTTGRIYLRDPALQNLSRKYRKLLKETLTPEWRYVYVDFGQFEAGILAGISQNRDFQKLYESDMIYERLAEIANTDRDMAKIYFYCFVYGGIINKGTERFFETYNLKTTVNEIVNEAYNQGYVVTSLGNKRIVNDEKDKGWILNHYIQGTSSLIFKQALINVNKTFLNKVELTLPVHDAALFKVHNDVKTDSLITQFKDAFVKWIPGINPVIKEKNFFEENII